MFPDMVSGTRGTPRTDPDPHRLESRRRILNDGSTTSAADIFTPVFRDSPPLPRTAWNGDGYLLCHR